jgi:hypothetical protein
MLSPNYAKVVNPDILSVGIELQFEAGNGLSAKAAGYADFAAGNAICGPLQPAGDAGSAGTAVGRRWRIGVPSPWNSMKIALEMEGRTSAT